MSETILDVIRNLYRDDVIEDYKRDEDGTVIAIIDADTWVAVGPDFDPEHPELDDSAVGYMFTAYEGRTRDHRVDGAFSWGGDDTTATLAAAITGIAKREQPT